MTILVTEKLYNETPKQQNFKFRPNIVVHAVRLNLVKFGDLADGTLNVRIRDNDETLLASGTITAAEFNTLDTYAWGMFSVELNVQLNGATDNEEYHEYILELEMTGYTDSITGYIGWNTEWENPFNLVYGSNQTDGVDDADNFDAKSFEFYEFK